MTRIFPFQADSPKQQHMEQNFSCFFCHYFWVLYYECRWRKTGHVLCKMVIRTVTTFAGNASEKAGATSDPDFFFITPLGERLKPPLDSNLQNRDHDDKLVARLLVLRKQMHQIIIIKSTLYVRNAIHTEEEHVIQYPKYVPSGEGKPTRLSYSLDRSQLTARLYPCSQAHKRQGNRLQK